jgi:hypothetical protein
MPARRLHWAVDGTRGWRLTSWNPGTKVEWSANEKRSVDDDMYNWNTGGHPGCHNGIILQFPAPVTLERIKGQLTAAWDPIRIYNIEVSADSNDGFDGVWLPVGTGTQGNSPMYFDLSLVPISGVRWLRAAIVADWQDNYNGCAGFWVFGSYDEPRWEFYDASGVSVLNYPDHPLTFPDAANDVDYHQYLEFKIKNLDVATHSYSLTVYVLKYNGDSIISNYIKLSKDGGSTKSTTITLTGLSAGVFSDVIRVYADMTAAQNPADGYHSFMIDVVETA